jgi:hypothetical protein
MDGVDLPRRQGTGQWRASAALCRIGENASVDRHSDHYFFFVEIY